MQRKKVQSGAVWEDVVGYSRATRVHNVIEVSGTVAVDEFGKGIHVGDAYMQTVAIPATIRKAIEDLGGSMENVIRTRIFVTDISLWQQVGKAHGEVFKDIKPVTTMVQVVKLIHDDHLVEIEASAIL